MQKKVCSAWAVRVGCVGEDPSRQPHKTCYWEQWHPVKTCHFEIDGSTAVRKYSKAVMPGVEFSSGIDHLSSTPGTFLEHIAL